MRRAKVFQERRLTQQADEGLAIGAKLLVSLIGSDQVEVEVGVDIRRASGIGAAEKGGHYPLIGLTSGDKAIRDGLVVMSQMYF